MTKEEYLKLCEKRWESLENLHNLDNLYDYEKIFSKIWQATGRDVLEKSLGKIPKDRRKKKTKK